MNDWLLRGDFALVPSNIPAMLLGLFLAFVSGQAISWTYMVTHSGLSYSRSFVNSLTVLPTIVSLVMMVMANNLVTAFGLMAVFAIVRFRTILRDTLDTTYIIAVIVIGMASGTQKYTTAVIGAFATVAMMFYLWYTSFGIRHRYDTILNLHWARSLADLGELRRLFERHSRKTQCVSQRSNEGYEGIDLSFRLLLRDPDRMDDLLTEVRSLEGVSRLTGLKAEEESEV